MEGVAEDLVRHDFDHVAVEFLEAGLFGEFLAGIAEMCHIGKACGERELNDVGVLDVGELEGALFVGIPGKSGGASTRSVFSLSSSTRASPCLRRPPW